MLLEAASEIVLGRVEADLGGSLFKKRLARGDGGKSGGYRTIVGYKKPNSDRIIFLYAFGKNAKATISEKEATALSLSVEAFIKAADEEVQQLF